MRDTPDTSAVLDVTLTPDFGFNLFPDEEAGVRYHRWLIDSDDAPPVSNLLVLRPPQVKRHAAFIAKIEGLRLIQLMSLGHDWIRPYFRAGVMVANARGFLEAYTAEHAIGLAVACMRRFDAAAEAQRRHDWAIRRTGSLYGSKAALLGFGGVGKRIYQLLLAHGVSEVSVYASHERVEHGISVHRLADRAATDLGRADVVISALPLNRHTARVLDGSFFESLRPDAVFVNVGRGGVVDTMALLGRLRSSHLVAGLDVVDPEPLPAAHPLWDVPRCIITPHGGGELLKLEEIVAPLIAEQVRRLRAGLQPVNLVWNGRAGN
jgi:phosphoglycerate dehydrogenase-like enzyme